MVSRLADASINVKNKFLSMNGYQFETMSYVSIRSIPILFMGTILLYLAIFLHEQSLRHQNHQLTFKHSQNNFPPINFPHHCIQVPAFSYNSSKLNVDRTIPPFNTRSFCLTSAICISPRTLAKPSTIYLPPSLSTYETSCQSTSPSLTDNLQRNSLNCTNLEQSVRCAQGQYDSPIRPTCPIIKPLSEAPTHTRWISGVAIVIPAYPYLGNIFHYAHVIATAVHISSSLPRLLHTWAAMRKPRKITIIFRGKIENMEWQKSLMEALIQYRLKQATGFTVQVETLHETDWFKPSPELKATTPEQQDQLQDGKPICARAAVLLGQRYSSSIWPFGGGPSVDMSMSTNGTSVPLESVIFRAATYAFSKVQTVIPSAILSTASAPRQMLLDLPPLAVGYARRNKNADPTVGTSLSGTKRRFSDNDELWFISMLNEEAILGGASFTQLETPLGTRFSKQVRAFRNVGFVAGIHGANLMNVVFMPPFSGMLEVSNVAMKCYIGGANSGLEYTTYMPVRKPTIEESWCGRSERKCQKSLNHRRVMIGEEKDKRDIRRKVRKGIARVRYIHDSFKHLNGVPVELNALTSEYEINWSKRQEL